jgi:hypothetical protein
VIGFGVVSAHQTRASARGPAATRTNHNQAQPYTGSLVSQGKQVAVPPRHDLGLKRHMVANRALRSEKSRVNAILAVFWQ